jgi:hypothetical protein
MLLLMFFVVSACAGAYAEVRSGYGHTLHDAITGALLGGGAAVAGVFVGFIAVAILAG